MSRVDLRVVLREWGRIGLVGFGGPPAHVALLRDLVVERRGWIDAREFEDANAACGLLPGPGSTQLAIYCAQRVAGLPGALVGGLAFIVPGLVLILVLAAAALGGHPPTWLLAIAAGAGAAVVPIVLQAGLSLARSSLGGLRGARLVRALIYLAAGAVATIASGAGVVVVLLFCGLVELVIRRGVPAADRAHAAALPALAWTGFKVGALSYGGGLVVIPLMQADAVDAHGWMTHAAFLNAVAFGQITPGPVTHTVAAVGYAAGGLGGGLLAAAFAFAPSFVMIGLGARRFERLRANISARAFLDGAGPAAIGAILGAAVPLANGLAERWQVGVAVAAAAALLARRPPIVVLVAAAALGGLAVLAGGEVPR